MTVLLAVLGITTVLGALWKVLDGRVRKVDAEDPRADRSDLLARLGHVPGERATLLQFSSAFCAPCRATRTVLGAVAESEQGVRHVEVDAEQHLDVVRELGILKTPTTLVLDARGREAFRASGQPRKDAVLRALPS